MLRRHRRSTAPVRIFRTQDGKLMSQNTRTGNMREGNSLTSHKHGSSTYKYIKNDNTKEQMKKRRNIVMNGNVINRKLAEELSPTIAVKKQLLDFTRKTYESYYNHYSDGPMGEPRCSRIKIKGIQFFDLDRKVAEVEVESINEKNYITKFEVNPEYTGNGFGMELLRTANASLSVNGIKFPKHEENSSKLRFFLNAGYVLVNSDKNYDYYEMSRDDENKLI